jgi:hypothetical protein
VSFLLKTSFEEGFFSFEVGFFSFEEKLFSFEEGKNRAVFREKSVKLRKFFLTEVKVLNFFTF